MNYTLPETVELGGNVYKIRSDYRAALDIIAALSDCELTDFDKLEVMIGIFYEEPIPMAQVKEAVKACYWFLRCGEEEDVGKHPRLMDWEQDFSLICAPITKALGQEVRSVPYMHWWTFVGYYQGIGDSTFAQVVSIRKKLQKHRKLEKYEQEYYRENRKLIDLKMRYTQEEKEFLSLIEGGGKHG